jgi:hypothetical protein
MLLCSCSVTFMSLYGLIRKYDHSSYSSDSTVILGAPVQEVHRVDSGVGCDISYSFQLAQQGTLQCA